MNLFSQCIDNCSFAPAVVLPQRPLITTSLSQRSRKTNFRASKGQVHISSYHVIVLQLPFSLLYWAIKLPPRISFQYSNTKNTSLFFLLLKRIIFPYSPSIPLTQRYQYENVAGITSRTRQDENCGVTRLAGNMTVIICANVGIVQTSVSTARLWNPISTNHRELHRFIHNHTLSV